MIELRCTIGEKLVSLRNWTKSLLKLRGIRLIKPDFHWGVDVLADVQRLSRSCGQTVNAIVDVGAHYGEWAGTALEQWPGASVYSFEPFPDSYKVLAQRTRAHRNWTSVNMAASAECGEKLLHLYSNSCLNSLTDNSSWAVRSGWNSQDSISVRTTRLDTWAVDRNLNSIDLLKIDTEGFDLQVLEGAEGLFKKGAVNFVYVEFNDLQPRQDATGGALVPLDSLLRKSGFRFINTYLDNVGTSGDIFVTSNALFMRQP